MENLLFLRLIFWVALLAFTSILGLIFMLLERVAADKETRSPRESPRSGKENIVWFPADFGRKHRPEKQKDPAAV